ncbi:MAG: FCD domain-containing protein [Cellvibrionaceae bacterium]
MAFEQIKQIRVADEIAKQIEEQLMQGILKPGEKLPSERELSKLLNVSRPSIREALHKLEARKILNKDPGGSAYVSDNIGHSFTDPLMELLVNHYEAPFELLEIRYVLEGMAAYNAALRCTDTDKEVIKQRYEALQKSHDEKKADTEATADIEFHLAIAEASHNAMLVHLMRSLFSVLHKSVLFSFAAFYAKPSVRASLPDQHKDIMDAIMAGDAKLAREKMQAHILSVDELLRKGHEQNRREQIAQNRLTDLQD